MVRDRTRGTRWMWAIIVSAALAFTAGCGSGVPSAPSQGEGSAPQDEAMMAPQGLPRESEPAGGLPQESEGFEEPAEEPTEEPADEAGGEDGLGQEQEEAGGELTFEGFSVEERAPRRRLERALQPSSSA